MEMAETIEKAGNWQLTQDSKDNMPDEKIADRYRRESPLRSLCRYELAEIQWQGALYLRNIGGEEEIHSYE